MRHVYPPTREGKIAMFTERRNQARAMGDWTLVHNCDVELATLGVFETVDTAPSTMERAVPAKARRGRPRLPRCEHGLVLARCPDCSPEEVA